MQNMWHYLASPSISTITYTHLSSTYHHHLSLSSVFSQTHIFRIIHSVYFCLCDLLSLFSSVIYLPILGSRFPLFLKYHHVCIWLTHLLQTVPTTANPWAFIKSNDTQPDKPAALNSPPGIPTAVLVEYGRTLFPLDSSGNPVGILYSSSI